MRRIYLLRSSLMGLISILRRPMARACIEEGYVCACAWVGVYGYSSWEKSIVARDVKKRCACLVRAHAFSQPRGNGRAGVWVVGGALVVVRCEDARAAAAREQQQLDYCARMRGGRMIACLPVPPALPLPLPLLPSAQRGARVLEI